MQQRSLDKYKQAQALIDGGKTLDEALKATNMGSATYYAAKKEIGKSEKKKLRAAAPKFIDLPAGSSPIDVGTVAVVICRPEQLKRILGGLQ